MPTNSIPLRPFHESADLISENAIVELGTDAMSRFLVLMLTLTATCQASAADTPEKFRMRTWTDPTGRYSVDARFLELVEGNVRLERADGRTVRLPLERLSVPDQRYIANTFSIRNQNSLESEVKLVHIRVQMLAELSVIAQEFRQAKSDLESTEDEQSKAMREAEVREWESRRGEVVAALAVNRLSIDALYAPPGVSKRMEEASRWLSERRKTQRTDSETLFRDAETVRVVWQLRAAAERLRQTEKTDAASTVSGEADLLEKELED